MKCHLFFLFAIMLVLPINTAYAQIDDDNPLVKIESFFDRMGGGFFGISIFVVFLLFVGFMASPGTVHIFTLIILIFAGILHAIHVFEFPPWMWGLMIFMSIALILQKRSR